MYLISMVWAIVLFLIREKINLFLLSRSKLFELVPHAIQKQDSHLLTHCWVSILLYIPMITRLIWELLYNGPVGFLDFIPITRCLLAMGIVGEIIDLVTKYRVPFNMLLHHSLEIIGGSIMIGGNIISFEPGFIMLAIPTIFSRFHITVFILDHISREGVSDDFIGELCLSPKFLGRMYFYSSVCEIISILVHCFFTGIYMFKYWLEIEEFNRIFLLVLIGLFLNVYCVGVDLWVLFKNFFGDERYTHTPSQNRVPRRQGLHFPDSDRFPIGFLRWSTLSVLLLRVSKSESLVLPSFLFRKLRGGRRGGRFFLATSTNKNFRALRSRIWANCTGPYCATHTHTSIRGARFETFEFY